MTMMLSRRGALWATAALTLGVAGSMTALSVDGSKAPRLYVFVPTLVRASALVPLLASTLKGVDITVFGRFADFESAVTALRPEAAISLGEGLEAVGLRPSLQGAGPTGSMEPYVVLTPNAELSSGQLSTATLGVVDIVGRRALPSLVQSLLGLNAPPRVRRVLKLGDLLPLLSLNLADGIVIPARFLEDFKTASRMDLKVFRPRTAELHRAAVAFPKGTDQVIQRGLITLSASALAALGVQRWEVVG